MGRKEHNVSLFQPARLNIYTTEIFNTSPSGGIEKKKKKIKEFLQPLGKNLLKPYKIDVHLWEPQEVGL